MNRRTASPLVLASLALGAALLLCGCSSDPRTGYSFQSTFDDTITSVSVPMFGNRSYSYGLEQQLTEAIIAEIRRSTPWRVVEGSASQATLSGVITRSELRKVTTGRTTGLVETQALVLTVDFDFRDARTGKTLTARRSFSAAESFVPAQGVNERLGTGEAAAVQSLAQAIVNELRSGW